MIEYSREDVVEIAKWQRILLWFILANIVFVLTLILLKTPILLLIVAPVLVILEIYIIYKQAKALKSSPFFWIPIFLLLGWIPIVGLIILCLLINLATRTLKSKGLRVGIMGVTKSDIDKYLSQSNTGI